MILMSIMSFDVDYFYVDYKNNFIVFQKAIRARLPRNYAKCVGVIVISYLIKAR